MKTFTIFAAALTGLTATAALATPNAAAKPDVSATASGAPAAAATADARRYCVVETPTGSRLPTKQCRTRAEWAQEGVDIDAK